MADRIQATPQSPGLGALARALRGAQSFAERPFGYPNPPVALLSELIGLPAVQRTVERMSYGEPLTTGRGMTLRPREDTTEAALAVLPMVPGAVRGGLSAVKRATDLNAIRDYVRSAQGLSGLPGTAVVKPKGGNWLKGPGSPEDTVQALKVRDRYGMTDPTELSAALGIPLEEAQALHASNAPNAALNQWLDQKLAKYIRNEMGTPEDPLRAQVLERGVSHVPLETLQEGAGWIPDEVALARKRAGFPEIGMVEEGSGQMYGDLSDLQRAASGWETAADVSIRGERAGDLMRLGESSPTVRANPWLAKVPPETPVYSFKGFGEADLGFSHLVDELRNATRAGSDLPRELQLRPEQLSKVSMPQAVELVDRINKWRAAQKAEADLARSTNVATQTFKEYPEQGYKWVEIKAPEEVQALPEGYSLSTITNEKLPPGHMGRNSYAVVDPQGRMLEGAGMGYTEADAVDKFKRAYYGKSIEDALQYEADVMGHCVGRYCPDIMEGRSRIFSLRDAKGQPHVTVEVRPGKQLSKRAVPDEIVQIKGKANRAPKDEYVPYVQDFVRSGRWGRVEDLDNAKLMTHKEAFGHLYSIDPKLANIFADNTPVPEGYFSLEDLDRLSKPGARVETKGGPGQGFARGGMVSAGPAQYDPARISALADQLLMEA